MSADSESFPNSVPAVAASRFDRNGVTAYNLALRLTGSPGAAWYATAAAFAAVTERVPADAAAGVDDQDLVLMSCWHARQLLAQVDADPEYAEQLRTHDATQRAGQVPDPAVAGANAALPIDQRELLGMNGLSGLGHAELAGLLHADPGLLAVMVAESRLLLYDLLYGTQVASHAGSDPDDRQAIALAALRQDGQLSGPEAQTTLIDWIAADPAHQDTIDALEAAGQAYRTWPLAAVPAGLRDAVVASAAAVPNPAPLLGTGAPAAVEAMPAGEHDRPVEPASAPDAGAADPGATVEWSSSEVAALGLEGAPIRPSHRPSIRPMAPIGGNQADWGGDEDDVSASRGGRGRERAPLWHIALVGVLLVAVVVVLVLTFTGKDGPTSTTPPTPSTTTTKKSTTRKSTTRKSTTRTTGSVLPGHVMLPNATVRVTVA